MKTTKHYTDNYEFIFIDNGKIVMVKAINRSSGKFVRELIVTGGE
jgi:hypothetical protein